MLKYPLLHPDILSALGRAGHGSRVLIADGNFPAGTARGSHAAVVHLNLSPGVVTCTQTLSALVGAIPIEAAAVMAPAKTGPYAHDGDPPIWGEFADILGDAGLSEPLDRVERFTFYKLAAADQTALTIATADQRVYANLLLTIGVAS